ncbi:MAG: sigma-70 family RNA polymerase sigma factor [Clostridia bacterium]|nr:sigma-70 family RNA polymerase sigma factor [Clostridia bacterium]
MLKNDITRDEFIEQNIPLVHSLCHRFTGRGIEYDDLFGAGCIGLVKAADAFDSSLGYSFSTYAVPVIMGEIRRLFRDGGTVKVSRSLKELSLKIIRVKEHLAKKNGNEPSVSEIANALFVTPEQITEAMCATQQTLSLTVSDDSDGEKQLELSDNQSEDTLNDRIMLDMALDNLDEQEKNIIKFRYFNGLTQSETAKRLSMSQVQVSRQEKKILLKLRNLVS